MVIKLVSVHYKNNYKSINVKFQTVLDRITGEKVYHVIDDSGDRIVTKQYGNQLYRSLKQQYPNMRSLTIIDIDCKLATYIRINEHYEIRIGNSFFCSCDNINEVRDVLEQLNSESNLR